MKYYDRRFIEAKKRKQTMKKRKIYCRNCTYEIEKPTKEDQWYCEECTEAMLSCEGEINEYDYKKVRN